MYSLSLKLVGASFIATSFGCASSSNLALDDQLPSQLPLKESLKEAYDEGYDDAEKYSLSIDENYQEGFCAAVALLNKDLIRNEFLYNPEKLTYTFSLYDPKYREIICEVKREDITPYPSTIFGEHSL